MASFDFAPEELRRYAVHDFKVLVAYGFIDDAVRLYASASAMTHRQLDEAIANMRYEQRQSFADHFEALTPRPPTKDLLGEQVRRVLSRGKNLP